jgi:hypothetical protein
MARGFAVQWYLVKPFLIAEELLVAWPPNSLGIQLIHPLMICQHTALNDHTVKHI